MIATNGKEFQIEGSNFFGIFQLNNSFGKYAKSHTLNRPPLTHCIILL